MAVIQIVSISQRYRFRLSDAGWGTLIMPVSGLNVVLRWVWQSATRFGVAEGRGTQTMEEVVWRPVFLNDDHDMFEV
jgi:hypothetical protein